MEGKNLMHLPLDEDDAVQTALILWDFGMEKEDTLDTAMRLRRKEYMQELLDQLEEMERKVTPEEIWNLAVKIFHKAIDREGKYPE